MGGRIKEQRGLQKEARFLGALKVRGIAEIKEA
jgi:hypothetical protein